MFTFKSSTKLCLARNTYSSLYGLYYFCKQCQWKFLGYWITHLWPWSLVCYLKWLHLCSVRRMCFSLSKWGPCYHMWTHGKIRGRIRLMFLRARKYGAIQKFENANFSLGIFKVFWKMRKTHENFIACAGTGSTFSWNKIPYL